MSWAPYNGDAYLDADAVEGFCHALSATHPRWVSLDVVGRSRNGRPLLLLTVGEHDHGAPADRPAFWLDGGTHAVEWTGISACLFSVSRWVEQLAAGDAEAQAWFSTHTVYCMPCISPDGVQAMFDGVPYLRSTLRPPPAGTARSGLDPQDLDGDGVVRWMRWRHPAGPFVPDGEVPIAMRPRRLDDDPEDAWFVASEGRFVNWDGVRWVNAPREFGHDLNRNFPDAWRPFAMFGMDSGLFSLSEPESRAVVDSVAARPNIACALTNHTYTGALLTAPARGDEPLSDADVRQMELLAEEAVEGTGYRVIRKYPTFQYDEKNPVVGCWDDTLCNTFGVPGYTLELWDPFRYAGIDNPEPAAFFRKPDPEKLKALLAKFSEDPSAVTPWTPFDHPQLGEVEIGGIDYLHTVRNPPVALLREECERGFAVADTLRRSLPWVTATVQVDDLGDATRIRLCLENLGYLATSGLERGATCGAALPVSATLALDAAQTEATLLDGDASQTLHHLDGWGNARLGGGANPIYPALPARGHRAVATWLVRGSGALTVRWQAGRGGRGTLEIVV